VVESRLHSLEAIDQHLGIQFFHTPTSLGLESSLGCDFRAQSDTKRLAAEPLAVLSYMMFAPIT
jgi:hypothetical protein